MKRNNSIYLFATALAITMAGCSNDDNLAGTGQQEGGLPSVGDTSASMFQGVIADGLDQLPAEGLDGAEANETRSTISDGAFSSWNENDVISVSDGTLNYQYKPTNINGASCQFTVVDGKNQFDKNLTGSENFYVFYPATAVTAWNGSTVSSMVYAQQLYSENIDNGEMGAYMATKATVKEDKSGVNFSFKHCCSVLEVNLSTLGVTPKTVTLKSNSGVAIAGRVNMDVATGNITVANNDATTYAPSTQSDVITLTDIAAYATVARFYILPVQLTGGVTVTIQDTDGNYYTKSTSTDVGNATSDYTISGVSNATVCKPYYKKVNFGTAASATRKGLWMTTIPGNTYFSMISTPGAHDACTKDNSFGTSSQCQDMTLSELLAAGVRQFDLRPGYKYNEDITKDNLYIWHGITSTGILYVDAMQTLVDFLKDNPTEAISIIMTKEDNAKTVAGITVPSGYTDRSEKMWDVIRAFQSANSTYFKPFDHSYYTMADFRGKISYVNRTGTVIDNTTNNITNWPDNGTVTDYSCVVNLHNANVQDKYNANGTTKQDAVKAMLDMSSSNTNYKNLHFNYCSSANSPKSYAEDTNPVITTYLGTINGPTGYLLADFIGSSTAGGKALLTAVVNQNYKYVFQNRSRVKATGTSSTGATISGDEYADEGTVYSKRGY